MVTSGVGDMVSSFAFRSRSVALKQDLQRLSTELTTGKTQDSARKFAGDLGVISGIDTSLARLEAYKTQTDEAGFRATTMQASLATFDSLATTMRQSLMTVAMVGTTAQLGALAAEGRQKFDAAIATLNTSVGGQSLFSGVETGSAATIDSEAILTALDAAIVLSGPTSDIVTTVSDWFDDPAGFTAQAYLGGAALAPANIAPGETANFEITAIDPAIRATLKGLALAAMLNRSGVSTQPDLQRSIASSAGGKLDSSQTARAGLSARLGMTEAQIEAAKTRNANEETALQITRNDLVSVDPYETATKLQEQQTQLETIYALTARMSRLSLLDYL